MPFVADRGLATVGPFMLRMTDREGAPQSRTEVLVAEPNRLLSYRWGEDVLTWKLEPEGDGTHLTLRHITKMSEQTTCFAAGWHLCIEVLGRFLDGYPVGAIVGHAAMDYGWQTLHDAYAEILGSATETESPS
jgi:uncharacterized protein YndB with AHSA1/START domain